MITHFFSLHLSFLSLILSFFHLHPEIGGYHDANAAKTWLAMMCEAVGVPLPPTIPIHDLYKRYTPCMLLHLIY